jgi:hypothetical protein
VTGPIGIGWRDRSMSWMRRAQSLHGELSAIADVAPGDPRWWLVAGGVAVTEPWPARSRYVISDAEPGADTFIGFRVEAADTVGDAIAWAHATRAALRELDGVLPEQPLAVTIRRGATGAYVEPSALDAVAFAIGDDCYWGPLAASIDDEGALAADLAAALDGLPTRLLQPAGTGPTPFVTISLGDEPMTTARHGHRRGWAGTNGSTRGPWLGIGRAGELAVISTCHMVVDGYGHVWLSGRIAERHATLARRAPHVASQPPPPLRTIPGGIPLGVAWRPIDVPAPRVLPLAYALGQLLYHRAARVDARFSPTFQIPVAPGALADDARRKRRVVPAIASVRFDRGVPEPYDAFAARTRETLAREAGGSGLAAQLLAAAQSAPAPLAWKRRAVGPTRPRWLEAVAGLVGGRGCVSRIHVDAGPPIAPSCAVSSPARLATATDPLGGCVVTVVDDGVRAAITLCGSGIAGTDSAAAALLDDLLAE